MQIDYGSPKQLERAMQTAKRLEWLTGYNSAGQRQIRSSYYSGTKMTTGGVCGWAKDRSYMVFHPALLLAEYNGTPETVKMVTEVADGFLTPSPARYEWKNDHALHGELSYGRGSSQHLDVCVVCALGSL